MMTGRIDLSAAVPDIFAGHGTDLSGGIVVFMVIGLLLLLLVILFILFVLLLLVLFMLLITSRAGTDFRSGGGRAGRSLSAPSPVQ